jgi:hypothetical protein
MSRKATSFLNSAIMLVFLMVESNISANGPPRRTSLRRGARTALGDTVRQQRRTRRLWQGRGSEPLVGGGASLRRLAPACDYRQGAPKTRGKTLKRLTPRPSHTENRVDGAQYEPRSSRASGSPSVSAAATSLSALKQGERITRAAPDRHGVALDARIGVLARRAGFERRCPVSRPAYRYDRPENPPQGFEKIGFAPEIFRETESSRTSLRYRPRGYQSPGKPAARP